MSNAILSRMTETGLARYETLVFEGQKLIRVFRTDDQGSIPVVKRLAEDFIQFEASKSSESDKRYFQKDQVNQNTRKYLGWGSYKGFN